MKQHFLKATLIGILILSLLLTGLTSCFSDTAKQEESSKGEPSTDAEGIVKLFDGVESVKIVYKSGTTDITSLCTKVALAMKLAFGVQPLMETDKKSEANSNVPEILIGDTNRAESDYEANVTAYDAHFFVGVSGKKLVINGSNGYMLEKAVGYFISECLPADTVSEFSFDTKQNYLGIFEDYTDPRWGFDRVPYYKGERISYSTYVYDAGIFVSQYGAKDPKGSKLIAVSNTKGSEFEAYVSRLATYGFHEEMRETLDDNIYVSMMRGEERVYTYYTAASGRANVIYECGGASVSEVSQPMVANANEGAVIYQYGLNMDPSSVEGSGAEGYENCGMLYIVKLADNSLIVIDGGSAAQMEGLNGEDAPHEELNAFLHEITGKSENEKITIACWFLTHGHGDHAKGFLKFLSHHRSEYDLKTICANLPAYFSDPSTSNAIKNLFALYQNCKEVKLHTGQKLQFADVTMQVLYTHEDTVSAGGTSSLTNGDFNGTSTVVKLIADGMSMLILGDATSVNESYLVDTYSDSTLKCDLLQVAHHGFNHLPKLYAKTDAEFALIPQSYGYFAKPPSNAEPVHIAGIKGITRSLKELIDDDKIFFAGNRSYTVGVAFRDGAIAVVKAQDHQQHGLS